MTAEQVRCLIIGSGPAGYTAAIYTSRAGLNPVLYEGMMPGGQLTTTTEIENFPGYPNGVSGFQLMEDFKAQAQKFGTDVRYGQATAVDFSKRPFLVTIDGEHTIEAQSVIISTGATAKYLGLESETRFMGIGVSACATCDGFFFRKKDVVVVGGGDTACEEALFLATICTKVYMVVRKDHLRASKEMQKRVNRMENIEILFGNTTKEVLGKESGVTGVRLQRTDGSEHEIAVAGFFLGIGHHPNTEIFEPWLDLDADGYIITFPDSSRTSVEGVFAGGDVQDSCYRQAITAAGSGAMAALDCERFLIAQR